VVIKNEKGERVMDTLIKADNPSITVSNDRADIKNLSLKKAPEFEVVRKYIKEIFKERIIVGYHIEM
jgi:hypothetical protein